MGLPLRAKHKCVSVWKAIIEKFRSRLALWKKRYLSKGGKLVLILCTLQNLPMFVLSLRLAPVTMVDELEKIIRLFLWGMKEGKCIIYLVAFEGIFFSLECLVVVESNGVRQFNLALLCKWFWKLSKDRFWVRLLRGKYGTKIGGIMPKKSKLPFGVSTWRGLTHVLPLIKCITHWKVGSGDMVSFGLTSGVQRLHLQSFS